MSKIQEINTQRATKQEQIEALQNELNHAYALLGKQNNTIQSQKSKIAFYQDKQTEFNNIRSKALGQMSTIQTLKNAVNLLQKTIDKQNDTIKEIGLLVQDNKAGLQHD
jgi:archaellum component FlaC